MAHAPESSYRAVPTADRHCPRAAGVDAPALPGRRVRVRGARILSLALALPCALGAAPSGAWAAPVSTVHAAAPAAPADPVYPSESEVAAAQAAAAAGAARVAAVEGAYAAARNRLFGLQQEVSRAMAAVAAAQAELEARTKELADAEADTAAATARHEIATRALRRDAALMYQDQSGLDQIGLFLTGQGPQDVADYSSALGHVAEQRQVNLDTASDMANLARESTRRAEVARRQQEQARAAADAARAAAQTRAAAALAETETIQAEQQRRIAELARLRNVAVRTEQDRQDGLAAEAARRAAEAARRAEAQRRAAAAEQRRQAAEAQQRRAAAAARARQNAGASRGSRAAQRPRPPAPRPPAPGGGGGDPRATARGLLSSYGWGMDQWSCLDQLWVGESGWSWSATNPSSGAYGIPQALPASKMASAGPDWLTNPRTQIVWGLGYIKGRYGSPCAAWSFWLAQSPHWY